MRPEITVIRTLNTIHQNIRCDALLAGLRAAGIPHAYSKGAALPVRTQKVAVWGWKWGKYWRDQGKDVLVMEMGYIGDRTQYNSLGWNGLNGYAQFAKYPKDGGRRFREHGGVIHPWRGDNEKPVLLLGQVPTDQSLQGENIAEIYNRWMKKIDRPVVFRQHPEAVKRRINIHVKGTTPSHGSLHDAFDNCSYALAFNSNALVDAVMYGVPAVAMDKGSMVKELCGEGLWHIVTPPREKRLNEIAWSQFTTEEIAKGWPIEKLWSLALDNR